MRVEGVFGKTIELQSSHTYIVSGYWKPPGSRSPGEVVYPELGRAILEVLGS